MLWVPVLPSAPPPPTPWPQPEQSLPIRLRGHTAGMDVRGRGGRRNWVWWQEAEQPSSEQPQTGQDKPGHSSGSGQHPDSNCPGLSGLDGPLWSQCPRYFWSLFLINSLLSAVLWVWKLYSKPHSDCLDTALAPRRVQPKCWPTVVVCPEARR